jgi:recombinational DNA repair protein RecR
MGFMGRYFVLFSHMDWIHGQVFCIIFPHGWDSWVGILYYFPTWMGFMGRYFVLFSHMDGIHGLVFDIRFDSFMIKRSIQSNL